MTFDAVRKECGALCRYTSFHRHVGTSTGYRYSITTSIFKFGAFSTNLVSPVYIPFMQVKDPMGKVQPTKSVPLDKKIDWAPYIKLNDDVYDSSRTVPSSVILNRTFQRVPILMEPKLLITHNISFNKIFTGIPMVYGLSIPIYHIEHHKFDGERTFLFLTNYVFDPVHNHFYKNELGIQADITDVLSCICDKWLIPDLNKIRKEL